MRSVNLNALIAVLLLGGLALWKSRSPHPKLDVIKIERTKETVNTLTISPTAPAKADRVSAFPDRKIASPAIAAIQPAPNAPELKAYTGLHRKVFLSASEAEQKLQLLKNPAVLRSMGVRLMRRPLTPEGAAEQNVAVEMLIEAMRSGDAAVATEVLKGVVTDGQVEDAHLDRATRESLAEVKADVLYQWSAMNPSQASELQHMLPGPVSQKIWKNVVDAQASNVAESVDIDQ